MTPPQDPDLVADPQQTLPVDVSALKFALWCVSAVEMTGSGRTTINPLAKRAMEEIERIIAGASS